VLVASTACDCLKTQICYEPISCRTRRYAVCFMQFCGV
jgi:hypothetical protein